MTNLTRKLKRNKKRKKEKIFNERLKATLSFKECKVCKKEYDINKKEFDNWFVKLENQELLLFCKNCWDN